MDALEKQEQEVKERLVAIEKEWQRLKEVVVAMQKLERDVGVLKGMWLEMKVKESILSFFRNTS